MVIYIEFCIKWNYGPEFDRVSKIINSINPNIRVVGNISPPRSGAFEVIINDSLLFSKFKSDSFPTKQQISAWPIK